MITCVPVEAAYSIVEAAPSTGVAPVNVAPVPVSPFKLLVINVPFIFTAPVPVIEKVDAFKVPSTVNVVVVVRVEPCALLRASGLAVPFAR